MTDDLGFLKNSVISCTMCGLSNSRTNAVPGSGPDKADILFVGEAPGRNEDLQGSPFVGAAGKLLSDALEYAGFFRKDVYITNIVKCRPPNNRRPSKDEVASCHPHLQKEFNIIVPKIICVLGNTAFGSLLGGNAITKNRGRLIRRSNHLYFVTIHPAAIIYNQNLKQVLKDDLKKLHDILDKIKKGEQVDFTE